MVEQQRAAGNEQREEQWAAVERVHVVLAEARRDEGRRWREGHAMPCTYVLS